eukprot:Em0006g1329a
MGAMWVVVAAARGAAGEVVVEALVSILLVPVVGLVVVAAELLLLLVAVEAVLLLLLVAAGAALLLLLLVAARAVLLLLLAVGAALLLLLIVVKNKEAFLCIRLRMTPRYSIDRSQRTVHNSWVTVTGILVPNSSPLLDTENFKAFFRIVRFLSFDAPSQYLPLRRYSKHFANKITLGNIRRSFILAAF